MASSSDLYKNLANTEGQLSSYTSNLPSEIKSEIQRGYTPALERALGTTKDLMSNYLGDYFSATNMGPGMAGSTAKDLSPTQKLGVMGRELGTMSGNLNASQNFSDYLGGQMGDMYNSALQASQLGQQNLADKYNRDYQLYQTQLGLEEAAKDRALQQSIANSNNAGFSFDPGDYETTNETSALTQDQIVDRVKALANSLSGNRGHSSYILNGQRIGDISAVHSYLGNIAKQNGVNLNPEWLWMQLGNETETITGIGGKEMPGAYYTPTLN